MRSDWNYFVPNSYAPNAIVHKRDRFDNIAEATEATGTDANSLVGASPFANLPKGYAHAEALTTETTTADTIAFRGRRGSTAAPADFTVGDNIEINGDGIMRKVTEIVDNKGIKFEPVLPRRPFRDIYILNWGKSDSTKFDFAIADSESPILKGGEDGSRIGSTLDAGAFYRGELLEKGRRTLPEIPADLKAAWPNPNNFVIPMRGL